MKSEIPDAVWLTEDTEFSLAQLAELSGLSEAELGELIEYGAVAPVDPDKLPWVFNGKCLLTVRAACRLRLSVELEPHAVAVIVSLLDRIRALEAELGGLRVRLPRPVR